MRYLLLLFVFALLLPLPALAAKSYEGPTLNTTPREPHVLAHAGATVNFTDWTLTLAPETFPYDVYFRHGCAEKGFPRTLGSYWQISEICEFHAKSHFNQARAVPQRTWMVAMHYSDEELEFLPGFSFPEDSLKIAYSPDHGRSWEMLRSSTVDTASNTVAAITDRPGGFMVMAGFVEPNVYYSYKEVKGASTTDGIFGWLSDVFFRLF